MPGFADFDCCGVVMSERYGEGWKDARREG